jgi:hypothetical protein
MTWVDGWLKQLKVIYVVMFVTWVVVLLVSQVRKNIVIWASELKDLSDIWSRIAWARPPAAALSHTAFKETAESQQRTAISAHFTQLHVDARLYSTHTDTATYKGCWALLIDLFLFTYHALFHVINCQITRGCDQWTATICKWDGEKNP